jgi:4-hydroxy-2-oxoheptanedioate aldolase
MDGSRPSRAGLRERLGAGERAIGTIVTLPSDEVVDVFAGVGFDFIMVDLEHSQIAEGDALRLIRHAFALGLPAVARIAAVDRRLVNRLLEAGAQGIQLSTIVRAEQVRDLVACSRYAPDGRRSVSLSHPVAGYGAVPLAEAVARPPALMIGQIETAATEDPVADILRAGLDVLFVGTVDMTVDLGFDQARLAARIAEIREVADEAGIPFGAYARSPAELPEGVRYAVLGADLGLLRDAAMKLAADARRG